MAKLIFIGGEFAGRVYEFATEKNSVGRGDQNTLVIHDSSVSTAHCEILVSGTEVIVRDLGSSNGTFVDGLRLHKQQCGVRAGQIVKFGSIEARLELEEPSPSDTATDITAAHAYCRFMREQQKEPKQPATISLTLETSPESAPLDHTVRLYRPPQAAETTSPPAPEKPCGPGKPSKKSAITLIAAALALGLAVLSWLIWGKR